MTMARAVREACERGEIIAKQGSGIRICDSAESLTREPFEHAAPGPRWVRVREKLLRDLYTGSLAATTPLPSISQLAARYHANHHTVSRAVASLVERGVLDSDGRHVTITGAPPSRQRTSVLLLTVGDPYGNIEESSPWVRPNFDALKQQCTRAGLRLEHVLWLRQGKGNLERPSHLADRIHQLGKTGHVLGTMVWSQCLPASEFDYAYSCVCRLDRPIAVLDEAGEQRPQRPGARSPLLVVSYDQFRSGYLMGAHLLSLGHRRVVFTGSNGNGGALKQRYAGLAAAFSDAGMRDAVLELTDPDLFELPLRESHDDQRGFSAARGLLEERGFGPDELPGRTAWYSGALKFSIDRLNAIASYRKRVTPALRRASEYGDCTAWVCTCDDMALEALRFLAMERRTEVTVCGFDDSHEAHMCGLTSYNFNGDHAVRAMIRHIIAPDLTRRISGIQPARLLVEGFVAPRGSSRPAGRT